MNNKGFDLLVMNKNFEIITLLNYTIMQWSRMYYESGYFSIEIPVETYSKEFKYIYTNARPEMGKIEQINYYIKDNFKSITLSGHFLENELNRRIVYQPEKNTNIINPPTWNIQKLVAEDLAFKLFNDFKDLRFDNGNGSIYQTDLKIKAGRSLGRGQISEHTRQNEYLGKKINTVLKFSKMSYRVRYDFDTSDKIFECWQGVDRRQGNPQQNTPIVFSTKYGNITNADLLISSTDYKNSYFNIKPEVLEEENGYVIAGNERAVDDEDDSFLYRISAELDSDYSNPKDFIAALRAEGHERLAEYPKILSLDFDTIENSYKYIEDFDLGDICSLEIPELGISEDAVLSGVYEVVKRGVWSMTLEFTI